MSPHLRPREVLAVESFRGLMDEDVTVNLVDAHCVSLLATDGKDATSAWLDAPTAREVAYALLDKADALDALLGPDESALRRCYQHFLNALYNPTN